MIKIIEKDINELVPYENNARINDKAIDIVAKASKSLVLRILALLIKTMYCSLIVSGMCQ